MNTSNNKFCNARFCIFFPLLIVAAFAISGVVMLLWNAVIPAITGFSIINYWQAMGLFALCRILFGGFKSNPRHSVHQQAHQFHAAFKSKFMDMTEDERQQFKNQFKSRCCK